MPYLKKSTGQPNVDRVTDDIYSILNRLKLTVTGGSTGTVLHNDLSDLNTGDYWHLTAALFAALTGGFSGDTFRFMTNWRLRSVTNTGITPNRLELWLEKSATGEEPWVRVYRFY